jgi:GNAT superfamily N-acetyltransferase
MVETSEARVLQRYLLEAPEGARELFGIRVEPVGDGLAAAMRADGNNYWSRALGFRPDSTLDDAAIAELVEFYRAASCATAIITAPMSALPADWDDVCQRRGLTLESSSAVLRCAVEDFHGGETDLRVGRLRTEDAPAWGALVRDVLGLDRPNPVPLLGAAITDPASRMFGAWDGEQLVGVGAAHLFGSVAALSLAATLPSHRRRGVHAALVSARVEAAAEDGCDWVTATTATPGVEAAHDAGFRNLLRAGFTHLYDRPHWRWRAR